MSSAREIKETEARKKGFVTAATAVGSVAAGVALASPAVGVVGLGAAAVLGYRWIKYRIDNGIRFT